MRVIQKSRITGEHSLVILFPVRRINSESKVLWEKIAMLIKSSSNVRLVVIDKTPNKEASQFFSGLIISEKIKFLPCDSRESIFLSQSKVNIPPRTWVSQIHDDDDFQGQVVLPVKPNPNSILRPRISVVTSFFGIRRLKLLSPKVPASILFSFIPSEIWNSFTGYIRAQKGECSPSLDIALNFVCMQLYETVDLPSFQYLYNNGHWATRQRARKAISKYMYGDGWGLHSNIITAEFASKIDKLLFSLWCDKHTSLPKTAGLAQSAFESLIPTKWHILNLWLNARCQNLSLFIFKSIKGSVWADMRKEHIQIVSLISRAYSSKSSYELAQILKQISQISSLYNVRNRLTFWYSELLAFPNIVVKK